MIAVMVLVDYKPSARLWGFMRFVIGRFTLQNIKGLLFFKILGSGHEGGFGLKPSASRQGLFCIFDTEENADAFLNHSSVIANYRSYAQEFFFTKLAAYSCRGSWAGKQIAITTTEPEGMIATLTRGSIRPTKAVQFWSKSPAAEESLQNAKGVILSTGLGEAPFFRQATFSLWENTRFMNAYARTGAHLAAIEAARRGGHFSESMFARFRPLACHGQWKGRHFG